MPGAGGQVNLEATEKNVVVANMAAELAAKRGQPPGPGSPASGVVVGSPPGPPPSLGAEPGAPPIQPLPPGEQANYARGVAAAAASGALGLPQRDVVGDPSAVSMDAASRPLHVPRQQGPPADYIAQMERAHQARAEAARRASPLPRQKVAESGVYGDAAVQAAATAAVLFLITQLPATRSFAISLVPKLFSGQSGGLKASGAVITAVVFGIGFYAATMATNYLSV